ncbi:MAG: protein translocase subunit SecF [Candidatus Portnoybacteria bacterium]|nr:protein translocase subunit SecF [Candidatus Portnoybacteria bacterium]
MMFIIKHRKIFYLISTLLIAASIFALASWGLNFGIEFTGGSLMEVEFKTQRPTPQTIEEKINEIELEEPLGSVTIQPTGEKGALIRTRDISEDIHQSILQKIQELGEVEELRFESIGPVIGEELKEKSIYSIIIALIFILIFVAFAFRKISFIVKSYKYGVLAIAALFHDIIIVLGTFSILGYFLNVEIGVAFVAALLATLGYSVNDTIVVFDRVRENLLLIQDREDFETLVGKSLKQTLVRSLNTSLTTLLVLAAILFLGGSSIFYFVLALMIGIAAGTYSSLFIASPLLVSWQKKT